MALNPYQTPLAGTSRPTRVRNVVLFFAMTLAIITYVDRVCISQATPYMQEEMGLTKVDMGIAFAAFGWAYALFEIPGGWLGDRIGPRKVLMRVVSMWSIFTVATGWAWNLASLVVCRFFFGMGEAGCFPNIAKMFSNWFPKKEQVRAQGVMWLSARWGGAFTPLLVGWMLATPTAEHQFGLGIHYKWVFLIFGCLGVVWAVLFFAWFRDRPKNHPSVNAAELEEIGDHDANHSGHHAMPWGRMIATPTVWMLWGQYFFMSYTWYFYITWFPTFLRENFTGLSALQMSLLACVPLGFGGLGSLVSGLVSGALDRMFQCSAKTRRFLGVSGMTLAGTLLFLSMKVENPVLSVLMIGLAAFASDLTLPGSWAACMDVGGRYTGALSGSMNMIGNAGGAIAPMVVPFVLEASGGDWGTNMLVFAISYFLAAACWFWVDSNQRLESPVEIKGR